MKTTEVKNSSSASKFSKPFFNKSGEGTFFAQKQEADAPFFQPMLIQPALAVGAPNDPFEQEADKVGRQVMDNFGQASSIQTKLSSLGVQTSLIQPLPIATRISRMVQHRQKVAQAKCDNCKEEEMMAQPKTLGIQYSGEGGLVSSNIEQQINSQRGGGSSMDATTKGVMESSFGADFSSVKIHTGTPAVQMSQQLNAHAFTVGSDIFFNKGRYQPKTKKGAGLLAHELTHTVQQGAAVQNKRINRRPLSQMLSKHEMAHLSTMNTDTLSRKEMAQLEQMPEEEMMQQKEIFESKEVDKVQKKDNNLSLRRCGGGTPPTPAPRRGTWQISQTNSDGAVTPTTKGYSSSIKLTFTPEATQVNCSEIAFVQNVRVIDAVSKKSQDPRANFKNRVTKTGWTIDRLDQKKYGWYGYNNNGKPSGTISPGSSPKPLKAATLTDTPQWNRPNTIFDFETCAICKSGTENGTTYGCFTWGFAADANNKLTSHKTKEHAGPSSEFNDSLKAWNIQATNKDATKRNHPDQQKLGPFT